MGLNWLAILLGAIVDMVSSTVLGIMVIILGSSILIDNPGTTEDLLKQLDASIPFMLVSGAVGLFCSGLGGYVAGMRAHNRPLLHAAYSAGPAAFLALASLIGLTDDSMPALQLIASMLLSICASIAGGVYARKRKEQ